MLYGSAHKAGNGGRGGGNEVHFGGGGGGGGGGRSHSNFAVTCQCKLVKGEEIPVTVNENMVSLGNYASVATGIAAKNGGSGSSGDIVSQEYGEGGSGGAGEGPHTLSVPGEYTTSGSNTGSSGGNGRSGSFFSGGGGGSSGYYGGGTGGHGAADDDYESGETGVSRVIGRIEISWGGIE